MSVTRMVCELEDREARRLGVTVAAARANIARRLNEAPGSLENLRRARSKSPRFSLVEKVRQLFIAELSAEIQRLNHEIDMARQGGMSPDCDEILAAQTHIEAAKELIGGRG